MLIPLENSSAVFATASSKSTTYVYQMQSDMMTWDNFVIDRMIDNVVYTVSQ